jgi:hypothetical protein
MAMRRPASGRRRDRGAIYFAPATPASIPSEASSAVRCMSLCRLRTPPNSSPPPARPGAVVNERASRPPLQLRRERKTAGAAARTAHGDENALLLLVVEIGILQHGPRLLLEQLVQRQIAGEDAVGGWRLDLIGRRRGPNSRRRAGLARGGFARDLFARWRCLALWHDASRSEPPHPDPFPAGEREFACAGPRRGMTLTSPPASYSR